MLCTYTQCPEVSNFQASWAPGVQCICGQWVLLWTSHYRFVPLLHLPHLPHLRYNLVVSQNVSRTSLCSPLPLSFPALTFIHKSHNLLAQHLIVLHVDVCLVACLVEDKGSQFEIRETTIMTNIITSLSQWIQLPPPPQPPFSALASQPFLTHLISFAHCILTGILHKKYLLSNDTFLLEETVIHCL